MVKTKTFELIRNILLTLLTAAAVAIFMHVLVYPANFAPSGIDGLATMLQHVTGWNAGIFTLAINTPLLIAAWFVLKKRYVLYTVLYTIAFSAFLLLLEGVGFYQYDAQNELLLPAIFGGVGHGLTGIMFRLGASSGGVDVMASMIQKKLPHRNVETIVALLCGVILVASYFVYRSLGSLLLAIVEIFVCERVTAMFLRTSRNAVKFEIVIEDGEEVGRIKREILEEIRHGATVMEAKGLYSDSKKRMIVCVVNYREIPAFLKLLSRYPDAFVYYSDVMGVHGNFDREDL